jgi:hypothetical protein
VRNIEIGTIPYIRHQDLIVFKMFSCGLRGENTYKARLDAQDAEELLDMVPKLHPLFLDRHQKDIATTGLADVMIYRTKQEECWWMRRLGL